MDELCESTDMVVMPVGYYDHAHRRTCVDADLIEVLQGRRLTCFIEARVHNEPLAAPVVDDGAFSVARAQERELNLVSSRCRYCQRIVSN